MRPIRHSGLKRLVRRPIPHPSWSSSTGNFFMDQTQPSPVFAAGAVLVCLTLVTPAWSHEAAGSIGGFMSGFLHPILGWDHVVAMVGVGLWGALLGAPALWLLPIVFPLVMAVGGAMGVAGLALPFVEIGIAVSAVTLGVMVAAAVRPPLWIAALVVGCFAVFHGHAHGIELPQAASPLTYSAGFVLATGLLHLGGIAFGGLARWPAGLVAVRVAGGAIALAGLAFLSGTA